jgi:hypothetical protein
MAKLPIEALRVAANFVDGIFFCPWSVVGSANCLELKGSFWEWVGLGLAFMEGEFVNDTGSVNLFQAFAWLTFMKKG